MLFVLKWPNAPMIKYTLIDINTRLKLSIKSIVDGNVDDQRRLSAIEPIQMKQNNITTLAIDTKFQSYGATLEPDGVTSRKYLFAKKLFVQRTCNREKKVSPSDRGQVEQRNKRSNGTHNNARNPTRHWQCRCRTGNPQDQANRDQHTLKSVQDHSESASCEATTSKHTTPLGV